MNKPSKIFQDLPKALLGDTGIAVSRAGLGTVKLGRNQGVKYPHGFSLPTDTEAQNLLAIAKDSGINLLDTAPAYGNSEIRLGQLLGNTRQQWVICSKAGEEFDSRTGQSRYDFSAPAIRESVARSLKRLKTDYIDIVLIHSDGRDMEIIEQYGALDTLAELKRKGLIKAFGMSSKTIQGGLSTLAKADCAMVTYNLKETQEREVIEAAHKLNKGILVKKVFASGHAISSTQIQQTFNALYQMPGVTSTILGTLNSAHLRNNLEVIAEALS
ncbi:MAG: aldo/keto reductase [Pseudomonadales bacterium]|uniref:Oxidoreductase, aldo/keto reductase family protein n=1 Tax=Oleiphilus messinensis TaxID=141451 RepID=A0A1Y0I5N3_9GAMM|nr:aldo/keto reductase [Oleiphilus messinensis]ARU54845.1 oxidoreductase, aldo/keto reductase family protein [Oleiphilus messinensis]MCG8612605.1 aldo/keto reductase [Pseudomonadales bacterium]